MARHLAIAAIIAFAFACSKDPDPEPDSGTMQPDAGSDVGGDEDMSSESDASELDANGGTNPATCNPIGQEDCVEADASKCVARFEDQMFSYTCGEQLGTAGPLESCERPNDIPGEDTCAPGLWCSGLGLPASDPPQRECLALCSDVTPCEDENRTCLSLTAAEPFGICMQACDPLDDQCPDGTKCGSYFSQIYDENIWVCDPDSGAAVGTPCDFASECGAGQSCARLDNDEQNVCHTVCGEDGDCPDSDFCQINAFQLGVGYCFTSNWSCVGSVTVPAPTAATVTVPIVVGEEFLMGSGDLIAGATVNVCAANDVDCANPLDTQTTDAQGLVEVDVPTGATGFDGYFEVSADGRSTALAYSSLAIAEAPAYPIFVTLFPSDLAPYWDGVTIDPTRGSVFAIIYACLEGDIPPLFAGRVSATSSNSDASTVVGYSPATIEPTRFDQQRTSTSQLASVGMVNHPTGSTDLTFTKFDGVDVAERTVLVRAGAITTVEAFPTP